MRKSGWNGDQTMRAGAKIAAVALLAASLAACSASKDDSAGQAGPKPPQDQFAGVSVRAPDEFYDPPAERPSRPGVLIRSEPLADVTLPEDVRAWRILYTTSVDSDTPATAVATVFVPQRASETPLPVITWEHGTTGLLQECMPSLASAPALGIPALDQAMKAGWAVVATDYQFAEPGGPHPYLIGDAEARAGLDSVRAARQLKEATLSDRTVVWGHSQGGHSALWTGIVGAQYAPDLKVLGVAAIAPATDFGRLMQMNPAVDKRLGPYLATAYSRFYPDVEFNQSVRTQARSAAREMAALCGFLPAEDPKRIEALGASFEGGSLALYNPKLAARIAENTPTRPIPVPVLIVQGTHDPVVLPAVTDEYVGRRCEAGQGIEYWKAPGQDHSTIVRPGSALDQPLVQWTADRFANRPAPKGCPTRSI